EGSAGLRRSGPRRRGPGAGDPGSRRARPPAGLDQPACHPRFHRRRRARARRTPAALTANAGAGQAPSAPSPIHPSETTTTNQGDDTMKRFTLMATLGLALLGGGTVAAQAPAPKAAATPAPKVDEQAAHHPDKA